MTSLTDLPDIVTISVPVKAWGGNVKLQERPSTLINRWLMEFSEAGKDRIERAEAFYNLIALHVIEDDEFPFLSPKGLHHIGKLQRSHPTQFRKLLEECCKLSGIGSVDDTGSKKKRSTRNGRLTTPTA